MHVPYSTPSPSPFLVVPPLPPYHHHYYTFLPFCWDRTGLVSGWDIGWDRFNTHLPNLHSGRAQQPALLHYVSLPLCLWFTHTHPTTYPTYYTLLQPSYTPPPTTTHTPLPSFFLTPPPCPGFPHLPALPLPPPPSLCTHTTFTVPSLPPPPPHPHHPSALLPSCSHLFTCGLLLPSLALCHLHACLCLAFLYFCCPHTLPLPHTHALVLGWFGVGQDRLVHTGSCSSTLTCPHCRLRKACACILWLKRKSEALSQSMPAALLPFWHGFYSKSTALPATPLPL